LADLLIIDDDEDVPELLADIFRGDGHQVRVSRDGAAGLEQIAARLPDVVLLDVEMPILSGPETADMMFLRDCGQENIPVILISGVVGLARVAERVGTPYFIGKPYRLEELVGLVARALLERRAPHPEARV
jgi:DNA-binding NtrC family response regulator